VPRKWLRQTAERGIAGVVDAILVTSLRSSTRFTSLPHRSLEKISSGIRNTWCLNSATLRLPPRPRDTPFPGPLRILVGFGKRVCRPQLVLLGKDGGRLYGGVPRLLLDHLISRWRVGMIASTCVEVFAI
jgi:hypothetical protein